MRANDPHGRIITPTHRPEEKGGSSPGTGTSLNFSNFSWGSPLNYAFGSSSFFIERRDEEGMGRRIELLIQAENIGGGEGKRQKCHHSGT